MEWLIMMLGEEVANEIVSQISTNGTNPAQLSKVLNTISSQITTKGQKAVDKAYDYLLSISPGKYSGQIRTAMLKAKTQAQKKYDKAKDLQAKIESETQNARETVDQSVNQGWLGKTVGAIRTAFNKDADTVKHRADKAVENLKKLTASAVEDKL